MSARDQLRNSRLFWERTPQTNPSHRGTVGFTLNGYGKGPTIYTTDLGHFQIRVQGLDNGWHPDNERLNARLREFVIANHYDISPNDQHAYMIDDSLMGEVIDIIRRN